MYCLCQYHSAHGAIKKTRLESLRSHHLPILCVIDLAELARMRVTFLLFLALPLVSSRPKEGEHPIFCSLVAVAILLCDIIYIFKLHPKLNIIMYVTQLLAD